MKHTIKWIKLEKKNIVNSKKSMIKLQDTWFEDINMLVWRLSRIMTEPVTRIEELFNENTPRSI